MRRIHPTLLAFATGAALAATPAIAADDFDRDAAPAGERTMDRPADEPMGAMEDPADEPEAAAGEYVVQQGDTLSKIAEEKLGSSDQWQEIARANGIDDPETLRVGQRLKIPAKQSRL